MKIACLQFNPIQENTYVVWDDTKACIVIDAGNSNPREDAALDNFIAEHGLKPVMAVNTHGHFDHTLGVEHLKQRYGIPFALSSKDRFLLDNAATSGSVFGVKIGAMPAADLDLDTLSEVRFGNTALRVIRTPATPRPCGAVRTGLEIALHGRHAFPRVDRPHRPAGRGLLVDHAFDPRPAHPAGRRNGGLPRHGESTTIGHESLYNPFVVEVLNGQVNYDN